MVKTIKPQRTTRSLFARSWMFAAAILMAATSCSDDETSYPAVDNQKPVLTLATDHIQTEPGRQFTIEGAVKDADGIRSITLESGGMNLDKTIDLLEIYKDSLLHDYNLSYSYTAASDWTDQSSFPVKVTVEDVVGNTTEGTVTVSADGDFTAPAFALAPSSNITVLIQKPQMNLACTVTDNKGLKYVKVSIPDMNINDSIPTGNVTEYKLAKSYNFPTDKRDYAMTVTVGDNFGNKATAESTISVTEMPDYKKMYLFDFADESALTSDLYGVPMLIERTGAYQYRARYYNQKAGTMVRFVPQKTSLEPICFGIDPANDKVLVNDPVNAKPITLDKVGYYEITFNTISGEYHVGTYTPTSEPFPQGQTFTENGVEQKYELSLAGSGLPGVGNWSTSDPLVLTPDANNKYLFYAEMNLTAGTEIEFTITPKSASGWWPEPFWRFESGENDSKENEYNTKNNGNNMTKVTVKTTGKYRFEFDTELLRSRFYPIN